MSACVVLACVVLACVVLACVVLACIVLACIVLACIVSAYLVSARTVLTYTAAAGLGVGCALLLDLVVLRTRVVLGLAFWCLYPIILVFQLVSNGILTGRGVVLYNPHDILGIRVAHAPVEDLAFGFALVVASLAIWVRLGRPRPG